MKIDLKEIEIKDLNGIIYKVDDLPKQIGNIIFIGANTIELSDIARSLHGRKSVDVNDEELQEIIYIVGQRPYYKPFIHNDIIKYLTQKLINNNKSENNEKEKH